jgi:hypothetical protein
LANDLTRDKFFEALHAVAVAHDIKEPHIEVRKLFDIVRDDVWTATRHEQQPFTYGSPPGRDDFYFAGK